MKALHSPTRAWALVLAIYGLQALTGTVFAQDQRHNDRERHHTDDGVLEEVVVTGSYIKRDSQAELASPVEVLTNEDLRNIGATSLDEIVNTLTINTGAQIYANNLEQGRNAGSTNVNLRGLGEASTLVLLNGTRNTWTPAVNLQGDQYVNLSTLVPMVAVGRMEVLKDGASAIYGSDAVAGVVNFITRDTFEGLEFNFETEDYSNGSSTQYDFSAIFGAAHEHGNFMAAFSYMEISPTTNAERWDDFKATQTSITGLAYPSNVFNGPIRYTDPKCSNPGDSFPAGLVFQAFLCRLRFGYYGNVISEEQRMQGYASANYEISEQFDFFGEMVFANNEVIIGSVPTQPVVSSVFVPENHPDLAIFAPGNPDPFAGVTRINADGLREVDWLGRVLGAGTPQNNDLKPFDSWRIKGGLRGDLTDTWSYTLSYAYSIDETSAYRRESIQHELQEALYGRGGTNRDEWFHFAYDARDQNSDDLMATILGFYGYDAKATQKVFDFVTTGELFKMGSGSAYGALGVQYLEDSLAYDYNDQSEQFVFSFFIGGDDFAVKQDTKSVFGEIVLPVTENFELSLAARYTDVEGQTSTDPKASFLWTATDSWSFRGSIGTSFRVPSLFTQGGSFYNAGAGFDPGTGREVTFREEKATNPADPLVPQTATSYNIGTTFTSENGITASLDYWNYDYKDYITYEASPAVLAVDPFGPQVLRNENGNVVQVTAYASNAGFLKTDGLDFSLNWAADTAAGTFMPFVELTHIMSYDMDDPLWGALDGRGIRNFNNIGAPAIEWRINGGLLWTKNNHSANVYVRYIDSYLSDDSSGRLGGPITDENGNPDFANYLPVDSMTTVDLQYSYVWEGLIGSSNVTTITLGARNIFDELPPAVFSSAGYDEKVHNPRGRSIYLGLSTSF